MLVADRHRTYLGTWTGIFLAHCLFMGVPILSIIFALQWESADLIRPVCLLLVLSFLWSLWSWRKLTGTLFDPYGVFLLAAMLFNGSKAILEIFGLNELGIEVFTSREGYVIFTFSTDTLLRSLLLVLTGLMAFHMGALLAIRHDTRKAVSHPRIVSPRILRWIGWGLVGVAVIPTGLVLRNYVQIVLSYGYFGLFARQAETGIEAAPRVLAAFLVPGALFLLAGSKRHPIVRYVSGLIILLYVSIQFFLGSRLWSTMPLIAYTWLWHRCIRPIPKWALYAGGSALLFVVFPLIPVIREVPGQERLDLGWIIGQFFSIDNPIVAIVREMGGTLLTIAATLDLVPATRNFQWGLSYGYALLTLVPNLFWEIHPAATYYGSPARWLVWTIAPWTAAAGGGYGYSFIAEAYLNFGWIGTPIFLAIVGFLYARLVRWAYKSLDPAKAAAVASWMAFFLIYARGEASQIVRPLVWYAFLPYVLSVFLRQWRRVQQ